MRGGEEVLRTLVCGDDELRLDAVAAARGRLHTDEAAEAIREVMPWLKTETTDDLVHFFERPRDYRRHHSRLAEWYWEGGVGELGSQVMLPSESASIRQAGEDEQEHGEQHDQGR